MNDDRLLWNLRELTPTSPAIERPANESMVENLVCPHTGRRCYFWEEAGCLLEGTREKCEECKRCVTGM